VLYPKDFILPITSDMEEMLRLRITSSKSGSLAYAIRTVNDLLLMGIEVRRVTMVRGSRAVSVGDFLIRDDLTGLDRYLKARGAKGAFKITKCAVSDPNVFPRIRTPIVGLYCGAGVSPSFLVRLVKVLNEMGFLLISFANSDTLSASLENVDAMIFPAGDSTEMAISIGVENAKAIRAFVDRGGSFIGICAGAFLGIRPKEGNIGPTSDDFRKVQDEIAAVEGEVLNDATELPPALAWSYKKLDRIYRVYPFEGLFRFRTRTSRHPISLGLPREMHLWMQGPIMVLKDKEARSIVEFHGPLADSGFGIDADYAVGTFGRFSALATKKVGKGNYILSSPHVDSPRHPAGWLLLANSLFYATLDSPLMLLPPASVPLSAKQSAVLAASLMDQSEELNRSTQRLRRSFLNLVPISMNSVSSRLGEDLIDIQNCLPMLSRICASICTNTLSIIHEGLKLDKLRESAINGNISQSEYAEKIDWLGGVLSKVMVEKEQMLVTAGRAMPALTMMSLKLEKESAEVFSKITKGEPRDFYDQIAALIRQVIGDKYFYIPWYDGKSGIVKVEEKSKDEGIIPPLLGIYVKTQYIRRLSESTRTLAVS